MRYSRYALIGDKPSLNIKKELLQVYKDRIIAQDQKKTWEQKYGFENVRVARVVVTGVPKRERVKGGKFKKDVFVDMEAEEE